ncbi:MAG TPA: CocE/NonD family hydrolase [Gammaproteobacteria bacterium]|nr:CocE/NonD family hydrolase [Gammaproteobacteria bacterium]
MKSLARAVLLVALALRPMLAAAQSFDVELPRDAADPSLAAVLHDLAERVLPVYRDDDPDRYLSNVAALQMAIGDPAAARDTRRKLRERLDSEQSALPRARATVYDIYVRARAIEASEAVPFPSAYARAFEEISTGLDDLEAYRVEEWLVLPPDPFRESLQRALDERRGEGSVALDEALELVRTWLAFDAYRNFAGLVRPLLAEDTRKRYAVEQLAIPVSAGATIDTELVRPRRAAGRLPTLLEFTLDRSSRDPREAAAHGYASVLTLARAAGGAAARPRPFETEGDDAWAVIAWIAQQRWSDGRVAMQGSGYGGFAAWAALKLQPPALSAIAASDPMAPGIDFPSPNRIFVSPAYRWVYGLLAPPNDTLADDDARWAELYAEWYRTGRRYRDFPALPGRASAVFRSWLNHPSYDRFWQKWVPDGPELAEIDIPVLTVTGYYSAGEPAALYYFAQHQANDADADHTLLIGPFDERSLARGAASSLRGLELDAAARIDPADARYEWLESVLKDTERPPTLRPGINYELSGANEWRHAPSLAALEASALRFYLQAAPNGEPQRLARQRPAAPLALTQTRDLADRSDSGSGPPRELVLGEVDARAGISFVTEPFDAAVDLAGRIRGELDFTINKQDVDLVLTLYELRASGEHVKLFDPPHAFRASYARDRTRRRLLLAGVRQQLPFQSERMIGARFEAGSRLLLTIGINKRADQQINYGAGDDVSEESIEDAGPPVRIRWHEGSFIEIPAQ